jgi:acetyltransferase
MPINVSSLRPFFTPDGVAVIGASATPGKLGYGVIDNLIRSGYQGPIYPVNPRVDEILGLPAYPDVSSVPDPVELAVIIIPAPAIPDALRACGQRGIRAAAILSGGFAEVGPEGEARQQELLEIAAAYGMRLVGPNGVGVLNPHSGLNTTFIEQLPDPGDIAFLSQSGALGGALIDWAKGQHIGLSYFASLGNAADVTETDLIAALAEEPNTRVITAYIESIHDGPHFMQVARQAAPQTPIVALKVGGTQEGARAVASHTASIGGSDEAYSAAFRQSGVIRARSVQELFDTAIALAYQQPPADVRVAILTNAGGPAAVVADALAHNGLRAPEPDEATREALRAALGLAPQLFNPIDMLGAASSPEYEAAARILLQSDAYDAVLAILVPNTANDPAGVADALARAAAESDKPLYACFMGDVSLGDSRQRLHRHRIPVYDFPEQAALALANARRWAVVRENPPTQPALPDLDLYQVIRPEIQQQAAAGRDFLTEAELYPLLEQVDFPLASWAAAYTKVEAEAFARAHSGPFAIKVLSPDILHKSDIGGVALNVPAGQVGKMYWELQSRVRRRVRKAGLQGVLIQQMAAPGEEVIIGMRRDATFGPMIMFGGGGVYVEALRDVSFRIAPLGEGDAPTMIAETVAGRLLMHGARGQRPSDVDALAMLIRQVAALSLAVPELAEFELNPVIVHPAGQGVTVVDARALLDAGGG